MNDKTNKGASGLAGDVEERYLAPPAMIRSISDPTPGTTADQAKLKAGKSIEGAAQAFAMACAGGDSEVNNCAHFLSNAFISAGYIELRNANACVNARCNTSAKRPVRARDMDCWLASMATTTGGAVQKNTGIWAVFQFDETHYCCGHVVIIDTNAWKYYGTGWYGDWNSQTSYKW